MARRWHNNAGIGAPLSPSLLNVKVRRGISRPSVCTCSVVRAGEHEEYRRDVRLIKKHGKRIGFLAAPRDRPV